MNDKSSNLKWPVSAAQDIAAPKEEVWRVISTPGNLESCHPFCRRNPVQAWDGAQSRDEVHYLNDRIFERRFREWHEGVGYDLDIYEGERQLAAVSWRIDETGPDSCRLTITARPRLPGKWPVLVQWFAHWLRTKPYLRSYLRSVVMGFEWFVTRGEPVPRNHWGRHPWFSPE